MARRKLFDMSGGYYNPGAPFLYTGGEAMGPGMECLQLRPQPPGPFHYLISEQAKSLVALQELQQEVGALLEFRDLVIETFPNLRTKMATASTPATMMTSSSSATTTPTSTPQHHLVITHSNIPVSIRSNGCSDWTPGVRVRKKIGKNKSDVSTAIQDSGFSTETSSKETHSASSTAPPPSSSAPGTDSDDELWNLLDLIHRKGTRLKDEVEALQGDFQQVFFTSSPEDVRHLRQERDHLLDRLAEMEAEVLASRVHTHRLQEDLEHLLTTKHDLEEQLRAAVDQSGEVNSRIHDLHTQFVSKNKVLSDSKTKRTVIADGVADGSSQQRLHMIDTVLGDRVVKVRAPDSDKIAVILKETNALVLQKHLLKATVHNQALHEELDAAARVQVGLAEKLDKAREENDELRFQLEDRNIELEGTRARVRMLEQLQKLPSADSSGPRSRTEISTASMKAMSPLPLNLQPDHHSSSTESAHDQTESASRSKRRPSKIPLKSYTAPKPPSTGKSANSGTAQAHQQPRSRSGEPPPTRPQSAHSWTRTGTMSRKHGSVTPTKWSIGTNGGGVKEGDKMEKYRDQWILAPPFNDHATYPDSLDKMQPTTIEPPNVISDQTGQNQFLWHSNSQNYSAFYDSIDDTNLSLFKQEAGEELAECDSLERHLSTISDHKS